MFSDPRQIEPESTPGILTIGNYRLICTCGSCPEQYDVFEGDKQVGYLRLRHGVFRAYVPDAGGESVYETRPIGGGAFLDNERERYLTAACNAIQTHYDKVKI